MSKIVIRVLAHRLDQDLSWNVIAMWERLYFISIPVCNTLKKIEKNRRVFFR